MVERSHMIEYINLSKEHTILSAWQGLDVLPEISHSAASGTRTGSLYSDTPV